MLLYFRSMIALAAFAALTAGCVSAAPPSGSGPSPSSPLNGTSWVLDSGTNVPAAAQPAPAPAANSGSAVTPAPAPAPIKASWLLSDRGARPSLTFSTDRDSVSGSTGCNRYFGNFSGGANKVWFDDLATTKMMCFDALALQETNYLEAMSKVTGYANNGTSLTLTTSDGRQLVFTPLSSSVGAQTASYRYVCDDGFHFTANYDRAAQSAAIELSTRATDTLNQETSGSGAAYASQRYRLHTKGNEALLNALQDGVTHHCVAPLSPQG